MKTDFTFMFLATIFAVYLSVAQPSYPVGLIEKYDRSSFKHWSDSDRDCQSTRVEVLIRDADGPIKLSKDGCKVISGLWIDPYTGKTFTNPLEIDIDHYVALKNAYDSGAYKWDKKKREQYANYLGNSYHLIAVSGVENKKKSDKGPDKYLPPNKSYQCEYVRNWLKIKTDWKLSIPVEEQKAINKLNCNGKVLP